MKRYIITENVINNLINYVASQDPAVKALRALPEYVEEKKEEKPVEEVKVEEEKKEEEVK